MRIRLNGSESHTQDVAARALVFTQHHSLRPREAALKFFERRARRATKTINGLVRITHGKNVLLRAAQQLRQGDVAGVTVLKFIDQDEARALPFLLEKFRVG